MDITRKNMIKNKDLKRRIIEISYKHNLSHLGSCITAVDIISEIYDQKKFDEPFVLSAGHAGLALYVVLEKNGGRNAEDIFLHHGVHPDRCSDCGIVCSTGSLGQGLPIAVGMALADRKKNVYCLISDGEMAEGSIWEALRIYREQKLENLKVYLNFNGWAAYKQIKRIPGLDEYLKMDHLLTINPVDTTTLLDQFPFLKGQDAHYYVMNEDDYKLAMEVLK